MKVVLGEDEVAAVADLTHVTVTIKSIANINDITDAFGDLTGLQTDDEIFLNVIPKASARKRVMCHRAIFWSQITPQLSFFVRDSLTVTHDLVSEELDPGCP